MPERYAIYYAPAPGTPLANRGAIWLGRDSGGKAIPEIARKRLDPLTGSARRYGFHATLKAPMALAAGTGRAELTQAMTRFARSQRAVDAGPIELALVDGFLALVPVRQSADLSAFAQRVVEAFEPFRAPPSAAEQQRRLAAGLTERQSALYDRYGYPYVEEQFRLHLTVTDRLPVDERDGVAAAARQWFAPVLADPLSLDRLVLFHESEPGAAFRRLDDFPLEG